jgi:hypothetical protein
MKKTGPKSKSKAKSKSKLKAKPQPVGRKKVELDLNVETEHPSLPAPAAAAEIRNFAPELSKRLQKKYGEGRVEVTRQKTFPADPATILITIGIFVGLRVAEALISKMTEDVYTWVKEKLDRASVSKAGKHRTKRVKGR